MTAPTLPTAPGHAGAVKSCCADLWAHPAVQLLAGEAFRPGGTEMTGDLLAAAELGHGDLVLDVGSGTGATMALVAHAGHRAIGIDYSAGLLQSASQVGPVARADAEILPFASASFGAVLAECVVSVFPDKLAALSEIRRVLRPEGKLLMSDVVLAGELPIELNTLLGWIACASGALPRAGWTDLLTTAGFTVSSVVDRRRELDDLIARVQRRLALVQGAVGVGLVPGDLELGALPGLDQVMPGVGALPVADALELGADVLRRVRSSIGDGSLGYVSLIGG